MSVRIPLEDPEKSAPAARPEGRARLLWSRGRRGLLKPLTISQVLSSAAGVLPMLVAAAVMGPTQFSAFALLTLASSMLLGLVRAGLLQPALIHQRRSELSFVPLRYTLVAGAVCAAVMVGVALHLDLGGGGTLALLSGSAFVPVLYDWLRFRAIALDRRWTVAQGDGLRLVVVMLGFLLPGLKHDAVLLQCYISSCLVVPLVVVALRLPRVRTPVPYRDYSRSAGWQVLDNLFGQTLTTVPLLVLGGAGGATIIAGVRLAQSLLGPLNLMFAAGVTNLVADGATRADHAAAHDLIRNGARLARLLSVTSVICVAALIGAVQLSGIHLKGVDPDSLDLGLLVIGGSLITTGWAGVHAVVLRLLDQQARATVGRIVVSLVTAAAFTVGFFAGGTDVSLVAGFAALAISSPLVFWLAARPTYRTATANVG